jgi:large subunit ribosomal protein L18
MNKSSHTHNRQIRVRASIVGRSGRPRLSVFRSGKHTYAQIIDDATGVTLFGASTQVIKSGTKTEKATKLGELIAEKAAEKGVKEVVFDRGTRRFHGRLAAIAQAARQKGLTI